MFNGETQYVLFKCPSPYRAENIQYLGSKTQSIKVVGLHSVF
jgi:hypothetical protein